MHGQIFDRFGGSVAVSRLVLDFYDRVLASERLAPYFAHADMRRLVEHQAKFITSAMGGPASYSDAALRDIHYQLEIDDESFAEMIRLFTDALSDFPIDEEDARRVIGFLEVRRSHVVSRASG